MADDLEQIVLWRKGAEEGNAALQFILGFAYRHGYYGVKQDYVEAAKWYGMAAKQGNVQAQHDLDTMHIGREEAPRKIRPSIKLLAFIPASIKEDYPILLWLSMLCIMGLCAEAIEVSHKTDKPLDPVQYEQEFYTREQKAVSEGKIPPTIVKVQMPSGEIVTGKWLFTLPCPKGFLCAQPDGSLQDEHGTDWNASPERDPPGPSR